jgi:dihydropteroate synthase
MDSQPLAERFPYRATHWQLRSRTLEFDARPRLMAIVNVTPDSFSDGGRFFSADTAVEHGLRLVAEGADLLDIGGESTRPGAEPVDAEEELRRVLPVVERLARDASVPISIDTSKASVARAAIAAGAEIINDVTALSGDPQMIDVAVQTGAAVVVMHMRGTPQTMQDRPVYNDVVDDVREFLRRRRNALVAAGVPLERICVDPGIGFGKTVKHNIDLIANCFTLHELGCPILVGHSNKSFLGRMMGDDKGDRTGATLATSLVLAAQGVQILRVHEVAQHRKVLSQRSQH